MFWGLNVRHALPSSSERQNFMSKFQALIWSGLLLVLGAGIALFLQRQWMRSGTIVDAVVRNDVEFVRNWSGDINGVVDGEHLLDVATGPRGGSDVVRELLRKGANPNGDGQGYSPLMNAASWVNPESVRLLLDAGADVDFRFGDKRAIDVVGSGSRTDEVKEMLLKKR